MVWTADAHDGSFLSSHRLVSVMRHQGDGSYGPASGRVVRSRIIADCWVVDTVVTEEWLVRDQAGFARCLGMTPRALAAQMAQDDLRRTGAVQYFTPAGDRPGRYQPEIQRDPDLDRYVEGYRRLWQRKETAEVGALYFHGANLFAPGGDMFCGHGDIDRFYLGYLASFPGRGVLARERDRQPRSRAAGPGGAALVAHGDACRVRAFRPTDRRAGIRHGAEPRADRRRPGPVGMGGGGRGGGLEADHCSRREPGRRMSQADVIVVGLGAMGAATLYQLARSGCRVVGLDRFAPPHEFGSSHGETRITRLAAGEGASYLPLVRRSHALWRELEALSGERLMQRTGGLIIGPRDGGTVHHGQDAFVQRTIALAEQAGIEHEVLSPAALMARFPQFRLQGDEIGYYEPEAGMLFPEACVRAQIELARRRGAVVRLGETVLGIEQNGAGVTVRTAGETLHASRCVVTAGAWIGKLLGGALPGLARPFRQTLHWFAPEPAADFTASAFPVFIWIHGAGAEDYFYGFPASPDDGGVKLASETYQSQADPDAMAREVGAAESAALYHEHVGARLPGLLSQVLRAKACLYTVTPDAGFIVDTLPGADRVLAVSACSGHGFKQSAALGEAIAERVLGDSDGILLDAFSFGRFSPACAG